MRICVRSLKAPLPTFLPRQRTIKNNGKQLAIHHLQQQSAMAQQSTVDTKQSSLEMPVNSFAQAKMSEQQI